MEPFEFVLVLVSIILGLGFTDLLSMAARTLRRETRGGLVHSLWSLCTGLLILQRFWSTWTHQGRGDWSVTQLALFLAPSFLAFLAASLLSPSRVDDVRLDSYFLEHRRPFFAVLVFLMLSYSIEDRFLSGKVDLTFDAIRLGMIALFIVPLLVERRWVQIGCAFVAIGVLVLFTFGWTFSLSDLAQVGG